jgi:hypothetical protein
LASVACVKALEQIVNYRLMIQNVVAITAELTILEGGYVQILRNSNHLDLPILQQPNSQNFAIIQINAVKTNAI